MNAFEFYATRLNWLKIAFISLVSFITCYMVSVYLLMDGQHASFPALAIATLFTALLFVTACAFSVKKIKIELSEGGRMFNLYLKKRLIYSNSMANFLYITADDVSGEKGIRKMKIHFTDKSFCFNLIKVRPYDETGNPNDIVLSFIGRYRLKQQRCTGSRKKSAYTYNYCNPNKLTA